MDKLQNGNQAWKSQEDVPDKDRRIEWQRPKGLGIENGVDLAKVRDRWKQMVVVTMGLMAFTLSKKIKIVKINFYWHFPWFFGDFPDHKRKQFLKNYINNVSTMHDFLLDT